ncbi:MAG TPA: hypothetical protein VN224_10375, partial [Xanthomonadales bacterium]|nr:hypothetical protein [Xanthomonadales bacterium]
KIADRDSPRGNPVPRPDPGGPLQPVIRYAERRVSTAVPTAADPTDRELFQLAMMLARFGVVTDASAALMAAYLLVVENQLDAHTAREVIVHLGRAGTVGAEAALLTIYRDSKRSTERQWCFLALIANGSRASWRSLREMPSLQSDELEQKTLDTFLASSESAGAPEPVRGVWRFLQKLFTRTNQS